MEKNQFRRIVTLSMIFILLLTTVTLAIGFNTKGQVVSFFRDIKITRDTQVMGEVVSFFGDVDIQGNVAGDVVAIFGKINVDGEIYGDTVSIIGGITVGSSGQTYGDSVAIMGHGIDNYGNIRGQEISIMGFIPVGIPPISMIFIIVFFIILINQLFAFGFSVVAVLLFKERLDKMATGVSYDVGKKFLIGILVLFGTFVGIAILTMTVIGAPLVVILIPALLILEFLGNTTAKINIGRRIGRRLERQWSIIMELFVGTIIYVALEVTILGKVITWIFKFIGIGEIIDSRLGEGKIIDGPKGV